MQNAVDKGLAEFYDFYQKPKQKNDFEENKV
jgi:hypothetical protein